MKPLQRHGRWVDRTVTPAILDRLRRSGAVLIEGPKASGKTSLARTLTNSEVMLDRNIAMRTAAAIDPTLVLDGAPPRLIDEYQIVAGLWDAVRGRIDDTGAKGQFILTGSATPDDSDTSTGRSHTGAGRIVTVRLRTLTLNELAPSPAPVSLADLLSGIHPEAGDHGRIIVPDLATRICRGGLLVTIGLSDDDAMAANTDYLDILAEVDIARVDGIARDPDLVTRFIRSWARNTATDAALTTMARLGSDHTLTDATVQSYVRALRRLFLIEDQPAWKPGLRSRVRLATTPKRHLGDPGLAAAALGTDPDQLLGPEIETLGFLFESQVVHDLRVHADLHRANVAFYRDNKGLETDAVVVDHNGRWVAFEVKLGPAAIDAAAATLLNLHAKVDDVVRERCGALVVISTDTPTYRRDDGVLVTSAAAVGP